MDDPDSHSNTPPSTIRTNPNRPTATSAPLDSRLLPTLERTASDSTVGPSSPKPTSSELSSSTQASLGRGAPPTSPKGKGTTQLAGRKQSNASILFVPPTNSSSTSPAKPNKPVGILQHPTTTSTSSGMTYSERQASMSSRPFSSASVRTIDAETESLQSEDLEGMSDTYDRDYYERERTKGNRGTGTPRPKSKAITARNLGLTRPRSQSRVRDDEGDLELGDDMERAMSPLGIRGIAISGDEDDEVERRDRGEELVRKRMKDRARAKRDAEKANRKREVDARNARFQLDSARRASYNPGSFAQTQAELLDPDFERSFTDPTPPSFIRRATVDAGGLSRTRDVSRARIRDSSVSTRIGYLEDVGYFAADNARSSTPAPNSPFLDSDNIGLTSPPIAGRIHSTVVRDDEGSSTGAEEGAESTSAEGGTREDDDGRVTELDDAEDEEDEDDSDELEGGAVEYTLKDRQDAINIEHPFGLPIWKSALYKKNRSVTRNAETALHATPSSYVVRHLGHGNILWTIFFGSWLGLVCTIVSGLLCLVPWGGAKYGIVVWELGGYLFWPFGKYVEGWSDEIAGEEEEDDIGYDDIEEEDEDQEDDDTAQDENFLSTRRIDVEDAGKTYGRGRGRIDDRSSSSSLGGTVRPSSLADQIWTPSTSSLPDEPRTFRPTPTQNSVISDERESLKQGNKKSYGTVASPSSRSSGSDDTINGTKLHDFRSDGGDQSFRVRALGRTMYWLGFYLIVAPLMLIACILCWGMIFTVPMAKLLWVLLRHLSNEPLSLHFRSPPNYTPPDLTGASKDDSTAAGTVPYPLRAGQRAPRVSRKSVAAAKAHGRLFGPRSTVLLCTYRAAGLQYYKYTVDGVNIMFINLLSLVFFVIADFFYIAPYVEKHEIGGFLALISGQAFIFVIALLSVIPLSYFIGMAVASISAQSSIGMGAVINASFGSIIEIILYCIALTQKKSELVEGSIVGSILAAVLLMPGLSMIGGAMRRKEQKFNARSAGVTSTMLIMAIIGILTPTLFYEIYGSFQLNCTGCDPNHSGTTSSCKTCYYQHIDPVDDPFYKNTVKLLSYYCAIILVLSYLIGLWFSLRTHASQIWQNAQPVHDLSSQRPLTVHTPGERTSIYKRLIPNKWNSTPLATPALGIPGGRLPSGKRDTTIPEMNLPQSMTTEEFTRAIESNHHQNTLPNLHMRQRQPSHVRDASHAREVSMGNHNKESGAEDAAGGHDAPNWSRTKSAAVLMGCTALYAVIAEILVDVVDVVLDGSGIPEKFLGVTLFALVPNTTEFMNAISFAINGNIALSMEIGSAYALQVCLIQAPAMLAFTAYYSIGKDSMAHQAFTLVFPRWDVIAILFSVFLLTYTYIEARANYYRGSILCLSYMVLLGGFYFSPNNSTSGDYETTDPTFLMNNVLTPALSTLGYLQAVFMSLFTR